MPVLEATCGGRGRQRLHSVDRAAAAAILGDAPWHAPAIEPVDAKAANPQVKQLSGTECSPTHQQTMGKSHGPAQRVS